MTPRRLSLVRAAWLVALLAALALLVTGLPVRYGDLSTVCAGPACADMERMTVDGVRALAAAGLTLAGYARYMIFLALLPAVGQLLVSAVLVWRGAHEPAAALFALLLLMMSLPFLPAPDRYPGLLWLFGLLTLAQGGAIVLFLLLFPDGRFVPRWTRWLVPAWIALNLTRLLPGSLLVRYPALDAAQWVALIVMAVLSQVYRYWRVSGPVQRQQTRWLVFTLLATLALSGALNLPGLQPGSPRYLVERTVNYLSTLSISVAVAIAVLRYRLWDIDLIIRRTLIYSLLAGLLALAYFGSVVALESMFRGLTGQGQNQLVTVVSTLAIAALFVPLRRRVQAFIDRRFYRRKYDAALTLAAFGATLRDEVELDKLSEHLLGVVDATMQPETVQLWLRTNRR